MEKNVQGMRYVLAFFLGFIGLFPTFITGALTEVPGINSVREVAASSGVAAIYLGFCLNRIAPRPNRGLRDLWPLALAALAPFVMLVVVVFIVEHGSIVPGVPWLLAGIAGSIAGAMLSGRSAAPKQDRPITPP